MRIAIMTLYYGNDNYGGLLQAYALCKTLHNMGHVCDVISYSAGSKNKALLRAKDVGIIRALSIIKERSLYIAKKKVSDSFARDVALRNERFQQFRDDIPHTKVYSEETVHMLNEFYDCFICGSDQVWNPGFGSDVMFLSFADSNSRKVSYAASLGKNKISDQDALRIKGLLRSFHAISVREDNAVDLISPLVDIPVVKTLDPTFLLSRDEWEVVETRFNCDEPYAFVYILGSLNEYRKTINEYCKRHNLRMVSIRHKQAKYYPGDDRYVDIAADSIGPREWLSALRHASIVFTDSFHGTAFSLNYEKEFWAFRKHKQTDDVEANDRLESLVRSVGLNERLLDYDKAVPTEEHSIDYKAIRPSLEHMKDDSLEFLKHSLEE